MIDINIIKENKEKVRQDSLNKGYPVDVDKILELDQKVKDLIIKINNLREERNKLSKESKGSNDRVRELKIELNELENNFEILQKEYINHLKLVPNIPLDEVPIGNSEEENVVIKTVGKIPQFNFKVKNHYELGLFHDFIDKERATKVTGTRFTYLKGSLVQLWWALQQFAASVLTNEEILKKIINENNLHISSKPFILVLPPLMLKTDIYDAMDRLEPREERYKIEGEELWLQGSAEHVLGSMHANEIINESDLPLRYMGLATSFRKEAGSAGKDLEGIFRLHQFDKLEMVSLSTKETGYEEHMLAVAIQEYLMKNLKIPYRVIKKCTFDIGKPNASGYDIDAWLPGQNKYKETHTADYMTDYQARRLKTRLKRENGEIEYVHNNDATVFAQRPLIAILENFQNEDGSITIPEVLRKYMCGIEVIK